MMQTEEFVNPKSMLTPAATSGIVTFISGAIFTYIGIFSHHTILLMLSFFVGCIVFHSVEFTKGNISKTSKSFYYVLNSLLIFAGAMGASTIAGVQTQEISFNFSPINIAYAESEIKKIEILEQKRPFFTGLSDGKISDNKNDLIKYSIEAEPSKLLKALGKLQILIPSYSITIEVDETKLNNNVKNIIWNFPEKYFSPDDVKNINSANQNSINIKAWEPFVVDLKVEYENGEEITSRKYVGF